MKRFILICITSFLIISGSSVQAQKGYEFPDSVKYKKNVIRWNLTPFLLWGKHNINIGYERVLKPYRSFSLNAGYFVLPSLFEGIYDSLDIQRSGKKWGFTVSGDYRFYFKKRNKRMAPDGLFWGAYGSFHHYEFENSIKVLNSPTIEGDLTLGASINIISAGVELGYQFIIKERLSIDIIFMGPSLSMYTKRFTLGGDLEFDEEDEYLQAIYDILKNTIPGFEALIQDRGLSTSGANLSLGFGMRYLIQIGYRF
ncbi:MAG: hypothetical protein DRI88_01310 [Bacteroidetes bacterium]|nr:MAG: hypothetical protein DRI72_00575 [Bacteroidota bacterium]RLD49128.1 MAG: hypothetical protein DRI88_01310 [Bacteroidota bacterium]RLD74436.1 MAG: hypothetical protein DRI87_00965 [Bacteroidota bacterium]RLD88787.1 MAG: hypothetical protein DRJ02_03075 [Bacteroidota bacterium]